MAAEVLLALGAVVHYVLGSVGAQQRNEAATAEASENSKEKFH